MSKKTVDERVVSMQFDNKNFERNVSTTMSTLDKLKQKLNFSNASKGFENLNTAANKVNMNGLTSAVETIQARFSAMQVVAITALSNITNAAINTGTRMIKALTLDPITTGFQEYETQINSVQTILANTESKGTTLTDVNAALDELNTYADQTIYNFTEMTRNIGTFTAAGVDLDKSVTSIKGIANLAAVSGSNSQQASTAMYQLSQALAAGRVSLMDWNSVVNAGMGGELFQNALKRTATQMGYNVDAMIEKYGSFRESLTEGGWLTAEVLTETLTQLSGAYTEADLIAQGYSEKQAKEITQLAQTAVDAATKVKTFTQLWDTLKEAAQSGWTQTWEILVGDFEEAKDLLTELSETFGEIIGSQAEARNTLLYDSMTSNWKKITDGITEAGLSAEDFKDKVIEVGKSKGLDIDSIVAEYGSLESAFKNGALSSDLLNEALTKMTGTSEEISGKLDKLRGKYKTNKDILDALTKAGYENSDIQDLLTKNTEGQTIALNDLTDAQLISIGYTAEQIKSIRGLSTYSELAGGSLKTFIDNVAVPQGRENLIDALRVSLRSIIAIFGEVGKAWKDVFPPTTADQVLKVTEAIKNFALAIRPSEETLDKLHRTFRGLFSILGIGKQILTAILTPIGSLISNFSGLSGGILDVTASIGDWLYSINEGMKAGNAFTSVGEAIAAVLDKIFEAIHYVTDGVGGLSGVFSRIGSGISFIFKGVLDVITTVFDWIRDNVTAGDIFAGLAGGGLFVLFKKISGLVDGIKESIENLFSGGKDKINFGEKFAEVMDSVNESLSSFTTGIKATTLLTIAAAVGILSISLNSISKLEPEAIARSLTAIAAMLTMLGISFMSITKTLNVFGSKGVIKAGVSLIAISVAINILAGALEKVSDLDMDQIGRGLIAIGGGLLELVVALKLINKVKIPLRTSIALLAIAEACDILGDALSKFSKLSWDEIGRGLSAMAGSLAAVTISISALSKFGGGGALLGSAGIFITVQSLGEMADGLKKFGSMDWESIGKGLSAMGGALLELTIALGVLSAVGGFGAILGGTAILITVQSLDEISENLKRMGEMSWDEIGRGLTAMGGALAELALFSGALGMIAGFSGLLGAGSILIAAQSLEPIADTLERLSALSWDEIGRGLTAMGGALAELGLASALTGLGGFSSLVGAGSILLVVQGLDQLANGLKQFGEMSWDAIGRGLTAMGGALAELGAASFLTGLGGWASLVGAGTIALAAQGLDELADSFGKFASMDWDSIGRGLTAMGGAMAETAIGGLLNTFSGFGANSISVVAGPLGELADSVQKWANVTVPEGLGEQLSALAPGIMAFNFSGWGADAIAAIGQPLGQLADSVKKWSGVFVPTYIGEQLKNLASGVSAFNFSGWGADAIAAVAVPLGNLADSIKKWSMVVVPENIKETLIGLASGVSAFNFSGWAADDIADIVEPLGNLAGAISKWKDVNLPISMGEKLSSLATGVKSFNLGLFEGGYDIEDAIQPIQDLAGAVDSWNGVTIPYNLGGNLTSLANGLQSFNNISVSNIKNVIDGLEDVKQAVINMTKESFKDSGYNIVSDFINSISSSLQSNFPRLYPLFKNSGSMLSTNISNGLKDKTSMLESTIKSILSGMIKAVEGYYTNFYNSGKYLVTGFANGISANTYLAVAKAKTMAQKAAEAARKELDEHSPSRVFYEIGDYAGLGFVNALIDSANAAYNAASDVGSSAKEGLTNAVSKVANMVNSDMDFQPTIRPVLDLSDVENGAGAISGLFGMRPTIGLSSARTINSMVNSRLQNGVSTGDVVSAIQDLKGIIGTSSGDTYNLNGITYDDGSNIADAIQTLVRAARIERRK